MIGKLLLLLLIGLYQITESAHAPSTNCVNFRELWSAKLQMPQPTLFKSPRRRSMFSKEKQRKARSIRAIKIEQDLKKNWKPYDGVNLLMENCLGLTMIESGVTFQELREDLHKQSLPRLELCLALTYGLKHSSYFEPNSKIHSDICSIIEKIFKRVKAAGGRYLRFSGPIVAVELARASHLSHCPKHHSLMLQADDAGLLLEFLGEEQCEFIDELRVFLPDWYRSGGGRDSRLHRAIFDDASPLAITPLRRACLTAACSIGNIELIKEIISLGLIHPRESDLCQAAQGGHLDAFIFLAEAFHLTLDDGVRCQGCILNIIRQGQLHIIDWMLQHSSSMALRRMIADSITDFMARIDLLGTIYLPPSTEHTAQSMNAYNLLQRHKVEWPHDFVDRLCGYGHVSLVSSIYREHSDKFTYRCGEFAATTNNIGIVRWISATYRSPCAMFSSATLDWASYHGNLEMIEILAKYRITPSAYCITLAAINGHDDVFRVMEELRWWSPTPPDARWMVRAGISMEADRVESSDATQAAIRTAARYGRIGYITMHRNLLLSDSYLSNQVYNDALEEGNVSVAEYLLSLGLTLTPSKNSLMSGALNNINSLRWILQHDPMVLSDVDLKTLANDYVKWGMLDHLKMILKERCVLPDEEALDEAVYGHHLPMVAYITAAPWSMAYSQKAADYIAEHGLVDFLIIDQSKGPRENRIVVSPSTEGFDQACAQGRLAFLKFAVNPAFGHVPSLTGADLAAEHGHQHVLQWLFDRLGMLPTAKGALKALVKGHYSIVSWLKTMHSIELSCDRLEGALIADGNAEMFNFVIDCFPKCFEYLSRDLDFLIEVAVDRGDKLLVDSLLKSFPDTPLDAVTRLLVDTWKLSLSSKQNAKRGVAHRVMSFFKALSSSSAQQSVVSSYIAKMRDLKGVEEVANSFNNNQDIPI